MTPNVAQGRPRMGNDNVSQGRPRMPKDNINDVFQCLQKCEIYLGQLEGQIETTLDLI
jgi:hypothetical protein